MLTNGDNVLITSTGEEGYYIMSLDKDLSVVVTSSNIGVPWEQYLIVKTIYIKLLNGYKNELQK